MKISDERLFPYPVLKDGNENFSSGVFSVSTKYGHTDTEYEFRLNVALTEKNLVALVEKGTASIVCHLECPNTKFRTIKKLIIGEDSFRISVRQIDGGLQLVAIIIANEDIPEYHSIDFDPDYNNGFFRIQKGNILGIANIPSVIIENKKENTTNFPSIFDITYDRIDTVMKIGLNDERIKISLPEEEYRIRSAHKNSILPRNIMNSMIVLPTLVGVLHEMAKSDSIDNYANYRWFRVINKRLKQHGCDLQNGDLAERDIFELSQKLLEDLFSDAMDSLNIIGAPEE